MVPARSVWSFNYSPFVLGAQRRHCQRFFSFQPPEEYSISHKEFCGLPLKLLHFHRCVSFRLVQVPQKFTYILASPSVFLHQSWPNKWFLCSLPPFRSGPCSTCILVSLLRSFPLDPPPLLAQALNRLAATVGDYRDLHAVSLDWVSLRRRSVAARWSSGWLVLLAARFQASLVDAVMC